MKKIVLILSAIFCCFIFAFPVMITIYESKNAVFPREIEMIFGIGFLIISICILVFAILILLGRIKVSASIQDTLFEMFITAIVIGITALLLISGKFYNGPGQ